MASDSRENGEVKGISQITKISKYTALTTPDTVETPEYEAQGGTQEKASRNKGLGTNPSFSLAGNGAQNPNNTNQAPYLDQDYQSYNPQYGQPDDGPTWSLAQPLPHIVRPGMRHGALPEDRKEDQEAHQNGEDESPEAKKQRSYESRMNRVNGPNEDGFFNTWSKIRHSIREPLAEWLGVSPLPTLSLQSQP
jgi:aquaglyceroporin related protein